MTPTPDGPEARAAAICDRLRRAGVTLAASLPDSWLTALLERIDAEPSIRHVGVTREDDAVGVCAGYALGGGRAVVVCQNAGVLLSANALAGYALYHELPLLVLAAARGRHDDAFFYQVYKGTVASGVAGALGLPWHVVERPEEDVVIEEAMQQAVLARRPVVVFLSRRALLGSEPSR